MLDHDENEVKADSPAFENFLHGGFAVPEQQIPAIRWSPEKYLAAAVLTDALIEVRDFAQHPRHKKQAAEDLEWIFSDASDSPFSFLELCTIFDLEPSYVRAIVLHWLRDGIEKMGEKGSGGPRTGHEEGVSGFLARVINNLRQG